MAWKPRFILYESDGATPVYEFPVVTYINEPRDPVQSIIHTTPRSKGGIIIDAGEEMWDLNIEFVLINSAYEDLMAEVDTIMSTIQKHTKYVFKVDRTQSSTKDYNVIRIDSLDIIDTSNAPRTEFVKMRCTLKADSW